MSESKRYMVGPTIEIQLPKLFSVEVDALYQRFGFTGIQEYGFAGSITRERTNSWEFPVILKYTRLSGWRIPLWELVMPRGIVNGTYISSGYSNE